jgi:hypothetical protein
MGSKLTALCVLVSALSIGGFINYQRNAPLDAPLANRPHAALPTEGLDALVTAYEAQLAELRDWVEEEPDPSLRPRGLAPSDLGGKWKAFERYQQESQRWKSRRNVILEREVMLQNLKKEQAIRNQGLDQPLRRILRRVITL